MAHATINDIVLFSLNKMDIAYKLYDASDVFVGDGEFQININTYHSEAEIETAWRTALIADALANFSVTLTDTDIVNIFVGVPKPIVDAALTGLSVQTSTGAVGTQISTTNDSWVSVSASVTTTASIAGNAAGDLVVEVAPTNSATAGDWVEKARMGNSQALTLAITLQSVQIVKNQMFAFVPKGYYLKVRSVGVSGTVSTTISAARKTLI